MRRKKVVFNADDLGMGEGIDRGIFRAVRSGLVKEVSVCVTNGRAREAVRALQELDASVGIGLHLSLTFGAALTGPLRALTDGSGAFFPLPKVLLSTLARAPSAHEVEREVFAQIETLRSLGVSLTHLNGHHHVHVFPVVRTAVVKAMQKFSLPHVRVPTEQTWQRYFSVRRWLISELSRGFLREAKRSVADFRAVPLVGVSLTGASAHRRGFLQTAAALTAEDAEWLVHPREEDESFRASVAAVGAENSSLEEVETLTDAAVAERLRALGIEPARFAELHA